MMLLPELPTKLPTTLKNQLMKVVSNGKYNFDELVSPESKASPEKLFYLMLAGHDGKDLFIAFKTAVATRLINGDADTIQQVLTSLVPLYGPSNFSANADSINALATFNELVKKTDAEIKTLGKRELENGEPFTQTQIDLCYEALINKNASYNL